ncbi:hypothetical protein L1049_005213 [Liquidambar formosana]|uniref:Uncharacterized protein n=1 Tax=Liquidambar formosana TaxID=63359 RepID=A0AAP0RPI3_LIQFO
MNPSSRPKPMPSLLFLGPFHFFLSVAGVDKPSAYDVLQEYDFPVGLLPKGIVGYELDKTTGHFSAYLDGTCSFTLENSYPLKYQSTITGVISKDRFSNLKGVSVKVLFPWLNIVEVVRDGNEL